MKKITPKYLSELSDGLVCIDKNLYIRTREGKRQAYLFIYRLNKKRHELRIGDTKLITPSMARAKALEYRLMLENGVDPKTEKQKYVNPVSSNGKLFKEFFPVAIEKIADTKQWQNPKSESQWRNTIKTYVLPVIGNRPLNAIKRDDIVEVLSPIWKTKPETASRLRGRIEAIFNLAIVMGLYDYPNPAIWRGNLSFFLAPTSKVSTVEHHEALTFKDLKQFFIERYNSPVQSVSSLAIMFGALTATRVEEFVEMQWGEVDFKKKIWSIPPERRKDKKQYPHRVPLSEQAMDILNRLDKSKKFVFTGQSGVGHLAKGTPRQIIKKRFKYGTMHGCRSTFSDWCAENGMNETLREKSLMHATGNEVSQAYQRSDLLEQRRPLMQAWANALTDFDVKISE